MVKPKFHVTDAELAVLQVLWDSGHATTREVCEHLYPEATTAQYYTVQKLLERLESRECVHRDRTSRAHVFQAAIDRDTLIQERLRSMSDSLCDGALLPMLSGLIKMRRWSASEQKELAKLLLDATTDSKAGARTQKSKAAKSSSKKPKKN